MLKFWRRRKKPRGAQKAQTRPFPARNPDVVLKLAMDRFRTQQQQIDSLDGKLGNLLGLGSALLAILAASLALGKDSISGIVWGFSSASFLVYLIMAVPSLRAYQVKGFEAGPDLREAWDYTCKFEQREMGWWAAESFTESYEHNKDNVELKVRVVKRDVWLIVAQTITLTLALFILTLT